jgi:hypothetical protein
MYSDPFFNSSSLSTTMQTTQALKRCPTSLESIRNVRPIKAFGLIVTMRCLTFVLSSKVIPLSEFSYLDQINILSPRLLDAVSPPSGERRWLRLSGLNADQTVDQEMTVFCLVRIL